MLLLSTELQGFPKQKQFHDMWWRNTAVSFQLYSVSSPREKLPDALECPCSDEVLSIQTYMNFFPKAYPRCQGGCIKMVPVSPWQMDQLVGALSHTPKDFWFDPQSRHIQKAINQCFSHIDAPLSLGED